MLPRWLRARNEVELEVYETINKWQDNFPCYSISDIVVRNKEAQKVIKIGKEYPDLVIPLLLGEMQKESSYLFFLLQGIVNDVPIRQESLSDVMMMCHDWLNWGKEKGYI